MNVKVSNLTSPRSNKPVPNQYEIVIDNTVYFQSYQTIIAKKQNGKIFLDMNTWDYSFTTSKYRNLFLRMTKKETTEAIKNGEIILCELN
jgi:hypothetical protein